MSTSSGNTSSILTLPSELIEEVIVICSLAGASRSIASLAQSCKQLAVLIYETPDSHLWRSIFLAVFDDPRPKIACLREVNSAGPLVEPPSLSDGSINVDYNWCREFKRRMRAETWIRSNRTATSFGYLTNATGLQRTVATLISVMQTGSLFPHNRFILEDEGTYPFPYIVNIQIHPDRLPTEYLSKNGEWLRKLLSHGLPPTITKLLYHRYAPRIFGGARPAGSTRAVVSEAGDTADTESTTSAATTALPSPNKDAEDTRSIFWDDTEEAWLLYKFVAMTGFRPNPQTSSGASASTSADEASASSTVLIPTPNQSAPEPYFIVLPPERMTRSQARAERSRLLESADIPSVKEQLVEARTRARKVVYDISYLSRDRCWGPFLPLSIGSTRAETLVLQRRRDDMGSDSGSDDGEEEDEMDVDGEGYEEALMGMDNQPNILRYLEGDDDDDDDDDDDNGHSNPTFEYPSRPDIVVPDYTFLAAARFLVEQNLREYIVHGDPQQPAENRAEVAAGGDGDEGDEGPGPVRHAVDAFRSLELLRMGSMPRYWDDAWFKKDSADQIVLNGDAPGKGKERIPTGLGSTCEGWDWAGVAGEWRRVVCWMDYHDLLLHSVRGTFSQSPDEAIRIVPMKLHVTHFSPPPPCPSSSSDTVNPDDLVWKLPVIHYDGLDPQNFRKTRGSVRMVGDGSVRWSMTFTYPNSDALEWVSECVQFGGIGSAAGILGMWTGVRHTRTDPLGPCWGWKVN